MGLLGMKDIERLWRILAQNSVWLMNSENWFDQAAKLLSDNPEVKALLSTHQEWKTCVESLPCYGSRRARMTGDCRRKYQDLHRAKRAAVKVALEIVRILDAKTPLCIRNLDRLGRATEFATAISEVVGIGGVALFGSVAKGMDRPDSDIDVFIQCLTRSRSAVVYRGLVNGVLAALDMPTLGEDAPGQQLSRSMARRKVPCHLRPGQATRGPWTLLVVAGRN